MKCLDVKFLKIFITFFFLLTFSFSDLFADDAVDVCKKMHKYEKIWSKIKIEEIFFYKAGFILSNSQDIGLNEEQEEKINNLKYDLKKYLNKTNADIKSFDIDLKEELKKSELNAEAINNIIDKKYNSKNQKAKAIVTAYINLKQILTEEQKKAIESLWKGKKFRSNQPLKGKGYKR